LQKPLKYSSTWLQTWAWLCNGGALLENNVFEGDIAMTDLVHVMVLPETRYFFALSSHSTLQSLISHACESESSQSLIVKYI